jgi:signal transduction histidine kinase
VDEARSRARDAETLLGVGATISSTLDLLEVVRRIARAAANAVGADSSGVYLMSERGILEPLAGYHVPKAFLDASRDVPLALDGFRAIGEAMRASPHTLWSDDVPNDARFGHEVFRRLPLQSVLIASLQARTELVGILVCGWWTQSRRFADDELALVRAIAAQAAIAIVNARLYAKAEELGVNRERVRVAHELHDRLSQSVFSLGLRLEWCLHHTPASSPVHAKLQEVWQDAGAIMSQMRDLIYRLSPDASAGADVPARLRKLVVDFEELSGVVVKYEERGDLAGMGRRLEEVLFKTLQEGFANIVKHAKASHVRLTLDVRDGAVAFELVDDGVGPPPGLWRTMGTDGRHGLRHMVDRIEGFGGRVELTAAAPSGFIVRGVLPQPVPS